MSFKLMDSFTATGSTRSILVGKRHTHHTVEVSFMDYGTSAVSALVVKLQGTVRRGEDGKNGLVSSPALAVGSTPENIANGAFHYRIDDASYSKSAVAAGTQLPSGYAISNTKYGVILVYINSSGTISFGFPATTQAYASASAAMTAADGVEVPPGKILIGRVLCYNNTGNEWNSQTDDLTDGSDITNAVFMDEPLPFPDLVTHTFTSAELAAQKAIFGLTDLSVERVRLYLSTLTGNGIVSAWYTAGGRR